MRSTEFQETDEESEDFTRRINYYLLTQLDAIGSKESQARNGQNTLFMAKYGL